jgi:NAD(P)-dependent dehydrogenase (short-subunit alcohol dehydrogenase family)
MVVVVTGAGSGIGRAIARSYAKRGADLVLADINEESLLDAKREFESPGIRVYAQVTDVTMADDIASLCENSYRIMGRCDVLVNNAGVAMFGLVEQTSLSDWKWLLDVNLWGVIYGCHYFYPRMIEQGGGGHIVNVSSAAGLGPIPAQVAYCASKYAVVGLSETLRGEGALNGIGVSVICPSLSYRGAVHPEVGGTGDATQLLRRQCRREGRPRGREEQRHRKGRPRGLPDGLRPQAVPLNRQGLADHGPEGHEQDALGGT